MQGSPPASPLPPLGNTVSLRSSAGVIPVVLIELWAGVGVLSLSFRQQGIPLVAFLERETLFSAFLSHPTLHPAAQGAGLFEDRLWEQWQLPPNAVVIVAGGPSCTSIAAPGKRLAGRDPSSSHLAETLEVAAFCKADFVLLENVPNLVLEDRSHGLFSALKTQARDLSYWLADPLFLRDSGLGVSPNVKGSFSSSSPRLQLSCCQYGLAQAGHLTM